MILDCINIVSNMLTNNDITQKIFIQVFASVSVHMIFDIQTYIHHIYRVGVLSR